MSTVQSNIEKKFEIHVKEHPGELLQHINSARKERRLCDFLIKVCSKEIPVHKIVLSEGSDYFKAMFSHQMKEVESGVAIMEGVDPECMLICIEYIYTGRVSISESNVQPLLHVASMLQLTKLCEAIGAFLRKKLDPNSFFITHKIANTFLLQGLKKHCEMYALENFKSIAVKEGFTDLENEFVKFLIESKVTEASEAAKCKTLLCWANSDHENRFKSFKEMFLNLQLEKIPASYRHYMAEKEPLVSESNKCLRKILQSIANSGGVTMEDYTVKAPVPPTTFDMNKFKRTYSNDKNMDMCDTLKYFWDNFDKEKYSIWRGVYKHNHELKRSFMVSNLIRGFFQRIDKMRKNSFGLFAILKKDGQFMIDGIWFWRGPGLAFELDENWQVDYEQYDWSKLDPDADDTKQTIKKYFTEEGDFGGWELEEMECYK